MVDEDEEVAAVALLRHHLLRVRGHLVVVVVKARVQSADARIAELILALHNGVDQEGSAEVDGAFLLGGKGIVGDLDLVVVAGDLDAVAAVHEREPTRLIADAQIDSAGVPQGEDRDIGAPLPIKRDEWIRVIIVLRHKAEGVEAAGGRQVSELVALVRAAHVNDVSVLHRELGGLVNGALQSRERLLRAAGPRVAATRAEVDVGGLGVIELALDLHNVVRVLEAGETVTRVRVRTAHPLKEEEQAQTDN